MYLGGTEIANGDGVKLGATQATKIMLGTNQVWINNYVADAPTSFTASNAATVTIDFTWVLPADQGVPACTYSVRNASNVEVATAAVGATTASYITTASLNENFTVVAVNVAGESIASNAENGSSWAGAASPYIITATGQSAIAGTDFPAGVELTICLCGGGAGGGGNGGYGGGGSGAITTTYTAAPSESLPPVIGGGGGGTSTGGVSGGGGGTTTIAGASAPGAANQNGANGGGTGGAPMYGEGNSGAGGAFSGCGGSYSGGLKAPSSGTWDGSKGGGGGAGGFGNGGNGAYEHTTPTSGGIGAGGGGAGDFHADYGSNVGGSGGRGQINISW